MKTQHELADVVNNMVAKRIYASVILLFRPEIDLNSTFPTVSASHSPGAPTVALPAKESNPLQ